MRVRQLRGIPVVDPIRAHKIGTVSDFLLDAEAGRLAAVEVQPRAGESTECIPASRIRRIGRHGVMLAATYDPETDTLQAANERWLSSSTLGGAGLEVLGDDGERVGFLGDATFDQDSLSIERYLLRARRWLFGSRQIRPAKVSSCSRELMVVQSGMLAMQAAAGAALSPPITPSALLDGQVINALKPADMLGASDAAATSVRA